MVFPATRSLQDSTRFSTKLHNEIHYLTLCKFLLWYRTVKEPTNDNDILLCLVFRGASCIFSLLYFSKVKVGLWGLHAVCMFVNSRPVNFWMPEPNFMKLGMYITAPEPILTTYFINPSHQSVCLYVHPSIVVRQRLGKNVTAATNTHTTIEELLDAPFSMRFV
jgi:hypothetical protein